MVDDNFRAEYDRRREEARTYGNFDVELDAVADATWVRLDVQSPLRAFRPAADPRMAAVIAVCREIAGAPLDLLTVRLPYRKPQHVTEYEDFFRAPVEFGALATAFLVSTNALVREQIRRLLSSDLPDGVPALETLARHLGISRRTLQRRLRDEGTTFHQVLLEFRRHAAPALLKDGRLGVSEVAFLTPCDR